MSEKASASPPAVESAAKKSTLVTHIENGVVDLLRLVYRVCRTAFLINVSPRRTAALLVSDSDSSALAPPYTFLLTGCLLYSYVIAASLHLTNSDGSRVLFDHIRDAVTAGFSLQAVALRSLPLLAVSLICAALGSRAFHAGMRTALLYLYGNQGFVLILFVLSLSALSDIFVRVLGGDDWIILTFLALIVLVTLQSARFAAYGAARRGASRSVRILRTVLFPCLLLAPLPLVGYGAIATGLLTPIPVSRPELRLPPVRLLSGTANALPGSMLSLKLSTVVTNPFEEPFVIAAGTIHAELASVSLQDFGRVGFFSPLTKGTYDDVDWFAHYRVDIESLESESLPVVLAKGESVILELNASERVTQAWSVPGPGVAGRTRVQASAEALLQDKRILLRLIISEPTIERYLLSEYFIVPPRER